MIVPGVGTDVGRPARSEAVRLAAAVGSTPITGRLVRTAAAASEPTPTGTNIRSTVACSASSANSVP